MKVAFLSEVNKSQTRKLLTHLELSLSERSENSRFIRCSLSLLILPSSFHQDSNNALFAENERAALLCEGPEALGPQQRRKCPSPPLCYSESPWHRIIRAPWVPVGVHRQGREMGHPVPHYTPVRVIKYLLTEPHAGDHFPH